mmetsp:Transcript_22336/g.62302  ORF Transcript_22336/g.62302 Transcript_22336/m.62302 type:complete len:89 (+) Transcript_22336:522-788(+)
MVRWEGHEIGIISTLLGCGAIAHGSMPRGWVKSFIHRQPIAAMSIFLFSAGVLMPVTVVPIRRSLGLPTNQYESEHPKVAYPKYESIN